MIVSYQKRVVSPDVPPGESESDTITAGSDPIREAASAPSGTMTCFSAGPVDGYNPSRTDCQVPGLITQGFRIGRPVLEESVDTEEHIDPASLLAQLDHYQEHKHQWHGEEQADE